MVRSLSDIDLSTAANDAPASALFSAQKNPQRIPVNTPPVFLRLRPCICRRLLRLVTKGNAGQAPRLLTGAKMVNLAGLTRIVAAQGFDLGAERPADDRVEELLQPTIGFEQFRGNHQVIPLDLHGNEVQS